MHGQYGRKELFYGLPKNLSQWPASFCVEWTLQAGRLTTRLVEAQRVLIHWLRHLLPNGLIQNQNGKRRLSYIRNELLFVD